MMNFFKSVGDGFNSFLEDGMYANIRNNITKDMNNLPNANLDSNTVNLVIMTQLSVCRNFVDSDLYVDGSTMTGVDGMALRYLNALIFQCTNHLRDQEVPHDKVVKEAFRLLWLSYTIQWCSKGKTNVSPQ